MQIPKSGEFYKHFKGKLYQIVTVAEHTEDRQKLVIYQALYDDFKVYARPLEMFLSEVDHEKYPKAEQKERFVKVEMKNSVTVGMQDDMELEEEEGQVEPEFLAFLDEDDWDEKYNILVSLRDKMTDRLVDNLAVSMDVEIPDGPIEKRYEQLKICVQTRRKYESLHLR